MRRAPDPRFCAGDLVYEIDDGGGLPGRVVASLSATRQTLVRLDPALSPSPGIRRWDRDGFAHRGYICFRNESLAMVGGEPG